MTRAGTGKTYASAFALRSNGPEKALFLVHREQIARQAMASYKKVFGNTISLGLLSGNEKSYHTDYLFSTMQMMAKQEIRQLFAPDEFQIIVVDEAHRIGSPSYQAIMEYFQPELWLGMTASPERTAGFDVYQAFDHNIAYEIRLQKALEENLLCPFHYFGITDLMIDGETFNDETGFKEFNKLTSDARVNYVLEKAEYFGYSGDRVKGLVFCSSKKEAFVLSEKFNQRGYETIALSGDDSQEKREDAVERLVSEDLTNKLDYIFTVDIFNEGVDIPEVNQVIMLRPTQSPIVFVQQLGRGLRKAEDKEYVVIIDFIGNYSNNFLIPIALSGDRSYNKDTLRKYVMEGNKEIPGCSSIHFDTISKERIFKSIDEIKGIKKIIRESYKNLKYKLGRIPRLVDFYDNGEVDPLLILSEYKTYHGFLKNVEETYETDSLSESEEIVLEYLSKTVARGRRPHELEMLNELISDGAFRVNDMINKMKEKYHLMVGEREIEAAANVLKGTFVTNEAEREKYRNIDILNEKEDGKFERMMNFYEKLHRVEFESQLKDLVTLGLKIYEDSYMNLGKQQSEFVLYEKYSRRDVCLLLNWGKDLSSTMYGMKRIGEDVAIFITYNKQSSDDEKEYIDGKPDYADQFMEGSNQIFLWDSQIGKGPESSYMQDVCEPERKHLFIKKSDAEGTDFYYLGQFDILDVKASKKKDNKGQLKDISKVTIKLQHPVRLDLKDYLETSERNTK